VEKQLRSVKYQAGKARNYQQYTAELNGLKSRHFLAQYHDLLQRQGKIRVQLDQNNEHLGGLQTRIDSGKARRSELDVSHMQLSNQVSEVGNELVEVGSRIGSAQQRIVMLQQRIDEQTEVVSGASARLMAQRVQGQRLDVEQDQIVQQLEQLVVESNDCSGDIESLQDQYRTCGDQLVQLQLQLGQAKCGLIDLMHNKALLNNRLSSLETQQRGLEAQRQRLGSRSEQIADQLGQLGKLRSELQGEISRLQQTLNDKQSAHSQAAKQAEELSRQADQLDEQLDQLRQEHTALASRQTVLADMEHRLEGVGAGVKQLLKLKQAQPEKFDNIRGMVAELIKVDVSHAGLIEAALGGRDQCLVAQSSRWVLDNQQMLNGLPGHLNIICLDLLGPLINSRDWSEQRGVLGMAGDLVRVDEDIEHLARFLLGKTVMVQDLSDAMRLRQTDTAGYRFLTAEGQIVEPDGTVRIGLGDTAGGLISRKSQLQAIAGQLDDLDLRIGQQQEQYQQVQDRRAQVDCQQEQLHSAIQQDRTEQVKLQAQLDNLSEQDRKLGDEQPLVQDEIRAIDDQLRECGESAGQWRGQIEQLDGSDQSYQGQVDQLARQITVAQQQRDQFAEQLTQLRVRAGQLSEKRAALSDQLTGLKDRAGQLLSERQSAQNQADTARQRIVAAEQTILQADALLAELFAGKERLQKQNAQLRAQRVELTEHIQDLQGELQELESQVEKVQQEGQALALQINELTVRQDTLIQRVQEELDIDVESAYSQYDPQQEQNWDQLAQQINDLRGKIDRLGNVNLDAIDEQSELEERIKFLTEQRDDLLQAQGQLEQLIRRLDQESRQRFIETFETVRGNFQQLFRKLFGGGKADLVLEEPDDVLESGIEIMARPPGKELQSISLLSGGEKTLTTVALLFGIFKSRPSPFCILDEVDAALDEANVDRFNILLEEFLEHSQFIIITHSKRTMGYAGVLYGITMQEAGVSKKVSVRFEAGGAGQESLEGETEAA